MTRSVDAETRRILDRYRRLILLGKKRLPLEEARRLVGPDCAYHLYFRHEQPASASARRRRHSVT
jgi:sulfur transfer protein SufE